MEAALQSLRMKDLKKRAKFLGVTADELDDGAIARALRSRVPAHLTRVLRSTHRSLAADFLHAAEDADDAKSAVVAVTLTKTAALKALKPRELKAKCRELGVDPVRFCSRLGLVFWGLCSVYADFLLAGRPGRLPRRARPEGGHAAAHAQGR